MRYNNKQNSTISLHSMYKYVILTLNIVGADTLYFQCITAYIIFKLTLILITYIYNGITYMLIYHLHTHYITCEILYIYF